MTRELPSDWNSRAKRVYERDNYQCQNCGAKGGSYGSVELHAHHGVPREKGGSHKLSNLRTYCKDCHYSIHHDSKMAPTSKNNEFADDLENTSVMSVINQFASFYDGINTRTSEVASTYVEIMECDQLIVQIIYVKNIYQTLERQEKALGKADDILTSIENTTIHPPELKDFTEEYCKHSRKLLDLESKIAQNYEDSIEADESGGKLSVTLNGNLLDRKFAKKRSEVMGDIEDAKSRYSSIS